MSKSGWTTLFMLALAALSATSRAQVRPFPGNDVQPIYDRLLPQIQQIEIFDNHSHPGFPDDSDVDAMTAPPAHSVVRLREENPELAIAARQLFEYPYNDLSPEHAKWLTDRKAELKKQYGDQYFSHILDLLKIEKSVANRVAMPGYLDRKRFLWAFFVDNFLFPFDNRNFAPNNPDVAVFMPLQEKVLHRNMERAHLQKIPATFDGYLQFIQQILEQNRKQGAVSIKFEIAYFRSLHFDDPPRARAEAIYAKYHAGGSPSPAEYADFDNFMFRELILRAAKLNMAVQIHTAVGIGDYYSLTNGNILGLENVLRDPRYSQVKFVLLHGGYPYEKEAIWLAARENVYLDSSLMGLYLYPSELKDALRQWLELYPDKVVFGADAFPFNAAVGAEESYWLAVSSARSAVAAALAEMVSTGEITESHALELAKGYLHDNAARIYAQ
jgi:hypothetical protein